MFFRSTLPSCAADRASCRCRGFWTNLRISAGSRNGASNNRAANLARSTLPAALSMSAIETRPAEMPVSKMEDLAFSSPYGSIGQLGQVPPSVTAAPQP